MGAPFDPEQLNTYSRISQLIATYDSHLVRVEPKSSLEFVTNIYPLRIALRIIPMCSQGSITRRTEDGPSWYAPLLCDLYCRYSLFCSQLLWHYTTLSIDRTNGYEHSYRSLANQSFESTPDSLTVHSTHLRRWASFQAKGA